MFKKFLSVAILALMPFSAQASSESYEVLETVAGCHAAVTAIVIQNWHNLGQPELSAYEELHVLKMEDDQEFVNTYAGLLFMTASLADLINDDVQFNELLEQAYYKKIVTLMVFPEGEDIQAADIRYLEILDDVVAAEYQKCSELF